MDCGSSKIEEGPQARCKNQPSVHGQLAGISKLNPRRLGTRFYKSEVRSDLASAERAGSAGKPPHAVSDCIGGPPPAVFQTNAWNRPLPNIGWREFLSPRAREAQILWFVASQGFLRGLHRRMCKTGFARRTLTGNGMRCARSSQGSICTNDGESRRVARSRERPCLAVQAYCKKRPSDHAQRAGISKLTLDNARPAFYKSRCGATVRSVLDRPAST